MAGSWGKCSRMLLVQQRSRSKLAGYIMICLEYIATMILRFVACVYIYIYIYIGQPFFGKPFWTRILGAQKKWNLCWLISSKVKLIDISTINFTIETEMSWQTASDCRKRLIQESHSWRFGCEVTHIILFPRSNPQNNFQRCSYWKRFFVPGVLNMKEAWEFQLFEDPN